MYYDIYNSMCQNKKNEDLQSIMSNLQQHRKSAACIFWLWENLDFSWKLPTILHILSYIKRYNIKPLELTFQNVVLSHPEHTIYSDELYMFLYLPMPMSMFALSFGNMFACTFIRVTPHGRYGVSYSGSCCLLNNLYSHSRTKAWGLSSSSLLKHNKSVLII